MRVGNNKCNTTWPNYLINSLIKNKKIEYLFLS